MAIVKIVGLYGRETEIAYYRKQGIYCYDLVWDKELATELEPAEAEGVIAIKDGILAQYRAMDAVIE